MKEHKSENILDFSNTEIAFASKSDKELRGILRMFRLMSMKRLVDVGSKVGLFAIRNSFPFAKEIVRKTIYRQFCGGESLSKSQEVINRLYESNILTMLDYGAEGKSGERELEMVVDEFLHAVEFAASNVSIPVVVMKLTAIGENEMLTRKQEVLNNSDLSLSESEMNLFDQLQDRLERVCKKAYDLKVGVFIDAEESWMQDTIDLLADEMMSKYNKERVTVYTTFQLYRHDRLEFLKTSHKKATLNGYLLGAKLVRGAYMDKERERAMELKYPSPIHLDKESTDRDYNLALKYCLEHYETIASCAATHNEESCFLQATHINEKKIPNNHQHLNFCQLQGMSDNITYNLGAGGYNVAKYVVYGKVAEVFPYLIRRAEENSSVTRDISRELKALDKEVKRRSVTRSS